MSLPSLADQGRDDANLTDTQYVDKSCISSALRIPLLYERSAAGNSFLARARHYHASIDRCSFTIAVPSASPLTTHFMHCAARARLSAGSRSRTLINEYVGADPRAWRAAIPAYNDLTVSEIYPGIDLVYTAHGRDVAYELHVAPGADLSAIAIMFTSFSGTPRVELDAQGNARVSMHDAEIVMHTAPVMYQTEADEAGKAVCVPVGGQFYTTNGTLRFLANRYDATRPLVIDPVVYSRYFGGTQIDEAKVRCIREHTCLFSLTQRSQKIRTDGSGGYFFCGLTESAPSFGSIVPVTASNASPLNRTTFAAHFDSSNTLLYLTFYGQGGTIVQVRSQNPVTALAVH